MNAALVFTLICINQMVCLSEGCFACNIGGESISGLLRIHTPWLCIIGQTILAACMTASSVNHASYLRVYFYIFRLRIGLNCLRSQQSTQHVPRDPSATETIGIGSIAEGGSAIWSSVPTYGYSIIRLILVSCCVMKVCNCTDGQSLEQLVLDSMECV